MKEVKTISTYQRILEEKNVLEHELKMIDKRMHTPPFGILRCYHNGNYKDGRSRYKYYQSPEVREKGVQRKFIPEMGNKKLISSLACNTYDRARKKDIMKRLNAVNLFLRHYPEKDEATDKLLTENDGIRELLEAANAIGLNQYSWMFPETTLNAGHREELTRKTSAGFCVRSKSEADIVSCLMKRNLTFRYEYPLTLMGTTVFPDFTFLHPITNKLVIWEHLGRMDDPSYLANNLPKIINYLKAGYIPGINIIFTFETADHPFTARDAEAALDYFLG